MEHRRRHASGTRRGHVAAGRAAVLAPLLLASACVTTLDGPQVTELLPRMAYASQPVVAIPPLLGHEGIDQRAWFTIHEPLSSLTIVEYRGAFSREEADRLREESAARARHAAVGAIARLGADGRSGWTWKESRPGSARHVAIVPYADRSFVLHLSTSDPALRDDDARLRRVLASFRRDPGSAHRILVPLAAVAAVALAVWVARRARPGPSPPPVIARPVPVPPSPLRHPPPRGE